MLAVIEKDAVISPCGLFRYTLRRTWDPSKGKVLVIGLNPSTADAYVDDPTIRREIAFAISWGYGTLLKGNLFAFRATDPKKMRKAEDPIGPENDKYLLDMRKEASLVICAWGAGGNFRVRDYDVLNLCKGSVIKCLGKTKEGFPRHPLYVKADTALVDWP